MGGVGKNQMNQQLLPDIESNEAIDLEQDELLMQEISESLLNLGFRVKLKGYVYVREAIYYYMKSCLVKSINAEIYTKIAQKYNVTTSSIDRAIKTSIEDTWYRKGLNDCHALFMWSVVNTEYHPTNSEFIASMSELIKLRMRRVNGS